MPRNLDMTALRAFVTVAECGGVTKAAGLLHLTQSAVSMQIKRLEASLDHNLFDRAGRGLHLTSQGEQLLSYGRRILALNDEVWGRMTEQAFEGEIRLGVPADIVYPHIPGVLQQFACEYPKVKINLISSFTQELEAQFAHGDVDLYLATEPDAGPGGETLVSMPLIWVGTKGGAAWRQRPLRLAFENACIFRGMAQSALDAAGVAWEMGVDTDSVRTIEAIVSADLAVYACLDGCEAAMTEAIDHGGALPKLPMLKINMYLSQGPIRPLAMALGQLIRDRYCLQQAA